MKCKKCGDDTGVCSCTLSDKTGVQFPCDGCMYNKPLLGDPVCNYPGSHAYQCPFVTPEERAILDALARERLDFSHAMKRVFNGVIDAMRERVQRAGENVTKNEKCPYLPDWTCDNPGFCNTYWECLAEFTKKRPVEGIVLQKHVTRELIPYYWRLIEDVIFGTPRRHHDPRELFDAIKVLVNDRDKMQAKIDDLERRLKTPVSFPPVSDVFNKRTTS